MFTLGTHQRAHHPFAESVLWLFLVRRPCPLHCAESKPNLAWNSSEREILQKKSSLVSSPGQVQEEPLSTSRIHCTLVEYTSSKPVHFHLRSHVTVELPRNSHAAYPYSDTGVRVCFPYFSSSEIPKYSPHTIHWAGFPSLTASCVTAQTRQWALPRMVPCTRMEVPGRATAWDRTAQPPPRGSVPPRRLFGQGVPSHLTTPGPLHCFSHHFIAGDYFFWPCRAPCNFMLPCDCLQDQPPHQCTQKLVGKGSPHAAPGNIIPYVLSQHTVVLPKGKKR